MSYPPTKPDATYFDSDGDRISESRAELKTAVDAINTVIDTIDTSGITSGQSLVWNGTKFVAGDSGARSSYGTRQNLGTITSAGTYNLTMTGDFAIIAFDVAVGSTNVNISVDQEFDTEYTIVAHRFSTDGGPSNHSVQINISDTNSSGPSGAYTTAQGAGAVGTKIFFSKFTSNESGRTLYMIDNLSIDQHP